MSDTRPAILIVAHPDGFLEVYGDSIDVHVCTPLSMDTPAGEALTDEYLDETLPHRFKPLHIAPKLFATHQVKAVRPVDEAERLLRLALVREAAAIRHEERGRACQR